MNGTRAGRKFREWFRHYIVAELLGTAVALTFAYAAFTHSHSYAVAAASGFVGEGIGFYGYFVVTELINNSRAYKALPPLRRLVAVLRASSTNLIVEFAPAEIIDNLLIRPLLMYYFPQHIKPYAIGFLAAKLSADGLFYALAIVGYEIKKRLRSS